MAEQPTRIRFCGALVDVACDRLCSKAWGRDSRPRTQLSGDPDDYVYVGDSKLPTAPENPGTYEGGDGKPGNAWTGDLNRWCVRQCERCTMVDAGGAMQLPDLENPQPNMKERHGR